MKKLLLYFVSLPNDLLLGWPVVLLVWLFWGENLHWEDEALVCNLKRDSWPVRTWYAKWGGTTFGHAIFYKRGDSLGGSPENYERIQRHEHVHVEQCEAAMLRSFILGLVVALLTQHYILAGAIWGLGYFAMGASGWLTAWLRGENPYRGSQHEESAYAQAKDDNT